MTTNILNQTSSQRRSVRVAIFRFRWIPIGILLALLVYAGFFINYHLVYAGIAEEVTIQSGYVQLAGMLVRPDTLGPHPAVVLLHGAGTRQTFGKWNNRIHTNLYLRQGFAVLSYDKRGSGNSDIDYQTVTFQNLTDDGVAAVNFLRSRVDIIPDQIGLLGVSESGWFTPEIAARTGNIAFIVNRMSTPLDWTTTVLFEVKNDFLAAGVSEADLYDVLQLQTRIWQFYVDSVADKSVANGPERDAINALVDEMNARTGIDDLFGHLPAYDSKYYEAKVSKLSYDPYPYLAEIDIPILYILAGKDVNIPLNESVAGLEQLKLEMNKDITIEIYPNAGHYLYRWDWFPLEGFYVPGYLESIGSWTAEQIK